MLFPHTHTHTYLPHRDANPPPQFIPLQPPAAAAPTTPAPAASALSEPLFADNSSALFNSTAPQPYTMPVSRLLPRGGAQPAPLPLATGVAGSSSEEAALSQFIGSQSVNYGRQPMRYGMAMGNQPPPGYTCHRCNEPGHLIKFCPKNNDPNYDFKKPKPNTGIPRAFFQAAEGAADAAVNPATGAAPERVLRLNDAGWQRTMQSTYDAEDDVTGAYDESENTGEAGYADAFLAQDAPIAGAADAEASAVADGGYGGEQQQGDGAGYDGASADGGVVEGSGEQGYQQQQQGRPYRPGGRFAHIQCRNCQQFGHFANMCRQPRQYQPRQGYQQHGHYQGKMQGQPGAMQPHGGPGMPMPGMPMPPPGNPPFPGYQVGPDGKALMGPNGQPMPMAYPYPYPYPYPPHMGPPGPGFPGFSGFPPPGYPYPPYPVPGQMPPPGYPLPPHEDGDKGKPATDAGVAAEAVGSDKPSPATTDARFGREDRGGDRGRHGAPAERQDYRADRRDERQDYRQDRRGDERQDYRQDRRVDDRYRDDRYRDDRYRDERDRRDRDRDFRDGGRGGVTQRGSDQRGDQRGGFDKHDRRDARDAWDGRDNRDGRVARGPREVEREDKQVVEAYDDKFDDDDDDYDDDDEEQGQADGAQGAGGKKRRNRGGRRRRQRKGRGGSEN